MRRTTSVLNVPAPLACAMTLCLCTYALSSCADWPGAEPTNTLNDVPVQIEFDAAGCPKSAKPEALGVDKAKRIVWQSVNAAGNPINVEYVIWLDPFRGGNPLKSNANGVRKSPLFNSDAPPTRGGEIEYKYTIVGTSCEDKPLDPHFRLR